MVDVLRSLKLDYIATNPASSCRGLHESLINYGNNERPELLTVMHEESGTGMAHGYAKVAGKPMALLFHGTVGLQHATMGHLQRVVRSGADDVDGRQSHGCRHPSAGRADNPLGAGSAFADARFHQVG